MIEFKEDDLYPLLSLDAYSYQDAKNHAVLVDDYLGFECEHAESNIRHAGKNASEMQQIWEHLSVQAMQTPYVEIRSILNLINPQPGETLVDLGAAYGRMGFVMAQHYPQTEFLGYEIELSRVQEAQRVMKLHNLDYSRIIAADLCAKGFQLPIADYYFVFDYGHERDVRRTLEDIKNVARTKEIQVIARGRLSRALIYEDHPWLYMIHEPRHYSHFSIFKS
jgi:hypothetical protein